jgi:hypothetical protein
MVARFSGDLLVVLAAEGEEKPGGRPNGGARGEPGADGIQPGVGAVGAGFGAAGDGQQPDRHPSSDDQDRDGCKHP